MSGPSGMAIDPTLLMFQQARAAAAAATSQQQQEGSSGGVKQEDMQEDVDEKPAESAGAVHNMDPLSSSTASAQEAAAAVAGLNGNGPSSSQATASEPGSALAANASKADSLEAAQLNLRDDAELAAFLAKMDEYEPILPDSVTRFYLEKAGFQSSDDRVTRMLGLAAQKFVSDIAKDAYAFARTRTTAGPGRNPGGTGSAQGPSGKNKDRSKTVLTMEDLSAALHEYGVETSRAPYYR